MGAVRLSFVATPVNMLKAASGGLLGLPPHGLKELEQQGRRQVPQEPPQAVCWGYRPMDLRNLNNKTIAKFLKSRLRRFVGATAPWA